MKISQMLFVLFLLAGVCLTGCSSEEPVKAQGTVKLSGVAAQ